MDDLTSAETPEVATTIEDLIVVPARMAVHTPGLLIRLIVRKHAEGWSRLAAEVPSVGSETWLLRSAIAGAAILAAAVGLVIGAGLGGSYAKEKFATTAFSTAAHQLLGMDATDELDDLSFDDNPY